MPRTLRLSSWHRQRLRRHQGHTPGGQHCFARPFCSIPENVNLYLDFANLSFAHDSAQVGVNVVSDGIAMQPKAAPLYFARGVLYVQLAEYEKGQADFEKAYELDPSQSLSAAAQGLAAAQENDLDRALANIQASLARKPNDPILLYLQADILLAEGRRTGHARISNGDALGQASRRLAAYARSAARGVLATLYLQKGQYKDAIEQCRKALLSDPKDRTAVYHLIQALRKTGNNAEIPDLLKRLALLRQQAAKRKQRTLPVQAGEGDTPPKSPPQPLAVMLSFSRWRAARSRSNSSAGRRCCSVSLSMLMYGRMETGFPSADWAIESPAALLANCRAQQFSAVERGLRIRHRKQNQRPAHQGHQLGMVRIHRLQGAAAWAVRVLRGRRLSRCAG